MLAQGLLLTNNICFIAINGSWSRAGAEAWMATPPICGYVAAGRCLRGWWASINWPGPAAPAFQVGLVGAMVSCALAGWAVGAQLLGVVAAMVVAGYYNANGALYRFCGGGAWWP